MIVIDASALLEVLLRTQGARAIEARIFAPGETLHAPNLIDIEVAQVIRRFAGRGEITDGRGREALDDLANLTIRRYPHQLLLPRIWGLRANFTAYYGAYVALAEVLDAPLLTCDQRLATAARQYTRARLA